MPVFSPSNILKAVTVGKQVAGTYKAGRAAQMAPPPNLTPVIRTKRPAPPVARRPAPKPPPKSPQQVPAKYSYTNDHKAGHLFAKPKAPPATPKVPTPAPPPPAETYNILGHDISKTTAWVGGTLIFLSAAFGGYKMTRG